MENYNQDNTTSPTSVSEAAVLYNMRVELTSKDRLSSLKSISDQTDEKLAFWLNISLKSIKNYRKSEIELKPNLVEHIFLLKALYQLGIETFGQVRLFNDWLGRQNFHLDNRAPSEVLNTISGIRFIEDRLIGMSYGDNA